MPAKETNAITLQQQKQTKQRIIIIMNKLSTGQESWPVQVFRFTTGKGWEAVDNVGNSDVQATPREGWRIDIPKFKVRIRLFDKQGNSPGYASRRGDQIYCPSRSSSGASGALILKFRSKEECIAFFDRLVSLNPTKSSRLLSQDKNNNASSTSTHKRRMDPAIDLSSYKDDMAVKRRKGNVMSYLVRLLHDDSFLKFVNDIEDSLLSTQDGAAILAAMKRSPETKAAGNHPFVAIPK